MSVDVDAVNERLNGLVTLLKAVGVDGVSNEKGGTASKRSGMPDARQLDDDQIEAIIKKLQMAQSEAPQIIAALEAQAASKKRQQLHQSRQPQEPPEQKQQHVEEEESDDDSFDEDANYPMVGQGCSDDISVVSDLTTPTVLVGVPVPEEEHYRDTLPPMIVGGGGGGGGGAPPMLIAPTKRKNLVGTVKPAGVVAPPRRSANSHNKASGGGGGGGGGAAAQRRKHYNATMEKLAHEGTTGAIKGSSRDGKLRSVEGKASSSKLHKSSNRQKDPSHSPQERTLKKSSKSGRRASMGGGNLADWDQPASQSQDKWNAFENTAATKLGKPPTKPAPSTMIDDDGFLMSQDITFDPFATASFNPFQGEKQKKSSKKSSGGSKGHKPTSSTPSSNSSSGGSHGGGSSKPRRSRRASCM